MTPFFGKVTSRAFLQLAPPSSLPKITPFDGYDSIELVMQFKKGNPFYGDTSVNMTYQINQVNELYELHQELNQHAFTAISQLSLDPAVLGTTTVRSSPMSLFPRRASGIPCGSKWTMRSDYSCIT